MEILEAIKSFTDKGITIKIEGFFEGRMYGSLILSDKIGLSEPHSVPFGGHKYEILPIYHNIKVEVEGKADLVQLKYAALFTDTCPDSMTLNTFRKKMDDYVGQPISIHYKEKPLPFDLKLVKEEPYLIRNRGLEHISHNVTIRTVFQPHPTLEEWAGVIGRALELIQEGYQFGVNDHDYCSFYNIPTDDDENYNVKILLNYKP